MRMIRHEYISVNVAVILRRSVEQALLIEFVVPLFEEDSLSVYAALNYVLGYIRNKVSGLTRHRSIP